MQLILHGNICSEEVTHLQPKLHTALFPVKQPLLGRIYLCKTPVSFSEDSSYASLENPSVKYHFFLVLLVTTS